MPVGEVLVDEASLDAVELAERLAHHVDGLGAGVAEGGHRGHHLLDRIDRREVGDEEGERDADEDDQEELGKPLQDVDAVAPHWSFPMIGPSQATAAWVGLRRTIM